MEQNQEAPEFEVTSGYDEVSVAVAGRLSILGHSAVAAFETSVLEADQRLLGPPQEWLG